MTIGPFVVFSRTLNSAGAGVFIDAGFIRFGPTGVAALGAALAAGADAALVAVAGVAALAGAAGVAALGAGVCAGTTAQKSRTAKSGFIFNSLFYRARGPVRKWNSCL